MNKQYWMGGCLALSLFASSAVAQLAGDGFDMNEAEATVITATRLTYDQMKRYALFEEHVVVVDPRLKLTADRLIVHFDETSKAKSIEAVGKVVITQDDTKAWAGRAMYDVASGKIFMEKNPKIQRGHDVLAGDTITFWRDSNKMICEPQARLVIYPQDDGARKTFLGE